jgi:hypothetical protein
MRDEIGLSGTPISLNNPYMRQLSGAAPTGLVDIGSNEGNRWPRVSTFFYNVGGINGGRLRVDVENWYNGAAITADIIGGASGLPLGTCSGGGVNTPASFVGDYTILDSDTVWYPAPKTATFIIYIDGSTFYDITGGGGVSTATSF